MRKWLIIAFLLLLLLAAGFYAAMKFTLPKAAISFMPVKWQNIPLGQKRVMLHDYLGSPVLIDSNTDHWQQNLSKIKRYVLDVKYNADTVAVIYEIRYEVEFLGMTQRTEVTADSLK